MAYTKRYDGRKFDELRPMEAKIGVVKRADGSAMFKIGDTIAVAAVYGPRDLHPRFLQNPQKGMLKCIYDMCSFSVPDRKRPGPNRRSMEISMVTEGALLPVLDLSNYPNSVIHVFIQIIQANAGTRCAGITAASMALADAGIPMKDLISSVSVGKMGTTIVIDLDKEEEDYKGGSTDIPVAITPRTGDITLLQLDGNIKKEELKKALEYAKKGCAQIYDLQKKTLREHYKGAK